MRGWKRTSRGARGGAEGRSKKNLTTEDTELHGGKELATVTFFGRLPPVRNRVSQVIGHYFSMNNDDTSKSKEQS